MTDIHDREPDTYAWRTAPAHLKTRRQLRAAGLAPGGHAPVAQTEHKRFGRRQVTYFYDVRLAVTKRTATPKQLLAVAKAIREHQARAAERHGIDRAELDRVQDPAPGWDHTPESVTHKEENPMSDTSQAVTNQAVTEADQRRLDDAYDLLYDRREWEKEPTGHGQRMAYLLATVAVNQARAYLDKLDDAVEQAERQGTDAVGRLEVRMLAAVEAAETRLTANTAQHGPGSVAPLADALAFSSGSDIAAARLAQLTDDYAADWGVRIHAQELMVDVDPDFDAVAHQAFAEAERVFDRKAAAVDIVSALPLADTAKAAVQQAIQAWHTSIDVDSQRWLNAEPAARQQLDADLAAAKVSDSDRARVGFVVDYLRGDATGVDLLASPVFVDPGQETRGRIPYLLQSFAKDPMRAAPEVGREIAVMTPADQERVRQAGKAIAAGQKVDFAVWPGYIDRDELAHGLNTYAMGVQDLRMDADYLAEGKLSQEERGCIGRKSASVQDETSALIDRLAAARAMLLDDAHNGKGLAAIERAQIAATITDIDSGRINGPGQLPQLLFADERTKASLDSSRTSEHASRFAAAAREEITQRIAATGALEHDSRDAGEVRAQVASIGFTLNRVASVEHADGLDERRRAYLQDRESLGLALTQAGVPVDARAEIRELIDTHAGKAGELGGTAAARTEQWQAKTAQVAATRDDAIAQRQAADAGRAKPPDAAIQQTPEQRRACTARIDTNLAAGQTPAPAGIRQLHSQEIGR
jgi:hypothetical protein